MITWETRCEHNSPLPNSGKEKVCIIKYLCTCVCVSALLPDLLLCGNGEFVAGDEAAHLLQ